MERGVVEFRIRPVWPARPGNRDQRHQLDTTGDNQIILTGHDPRRGSVHRVQTRSAKAADGDAGDTIRQTGQQNGRAGHVRALIVHTVAHAKDDVIHIGNGKGSALVQCCQHLCGQLHWR